MEKLISVIMSTYNEPIDYLKESIESILNQTYKNIEFLIIIDNPENDELIKVIYEYAKKDTRIKVIENKENLGLVKSLNKGLSFATGDIIARMDADDISDRNRLKSQLSFINKYEYDLVSSNYILFYSDNEVEEKTIFPETYEECKKKLRHTNCLPHPCWFGYKKVFDELKGYREIKACEDYDFAIRAVCAGYKIGNCQEFLFKYRYNNKSISRTNESFQFLVTKYIAKSFKNGYFVKYDDYKKFLNSEEFFKKKDKIDNMLLIKGLFKESSNICMKMYYLCRLITNYYFWETKLIMFS
ncbi:glycosyltransferase [Turicibacter sanguinis]|uniref:glycosyltransferase family 2 protein n=1 Tax=Turicibacter sanguinis TaxID=154288 RepID=UPI00325C0480